MILLPLLFAFLAAAGAPLPTPHPGLVILVASESLADPSLRERIEGLVGDGARLELRMSAESLAELPGRWRIAPEDLVRADDQELARALSQAEVIELRGGSFIQWFKTLLPESGETRLARALRKAWREGAHVIAYGNAASFVAGAAIIPRSELDRPRRNPREVDLETAVVGLGLGPRALVEARGWQVGDARELLHQMWKLEVDLGFYLQGEVALVTHFAPYRVDVVGPGSALLVDLSDARRQKRAIRRGRLALLGAGDEWNFGYARVMPASEELDRPATRAAGEERFDAGELDPRALLRKFLEAPERPLRWGLAQGELLLWADEGTRVWRGSEGEACVDGVAFDLDWERGAERGSPR